MSPLIDQVALDWPPERWRDYTTLVAVSGGADSVALLLALHELTRIHAGRGALVVAHVNHRLRGDDSDNDARWVEELATALGLEFLTGCAPQPGESVQGLSREGFLRRERYGLLRSMARQAGARYACTAHQANDQAETVLFRMLRGTGIDGLAGIPRMRPFGDGITLVRPLLNVTRKEIVRWLEERGQSWRVDSSNADPGIARNRIRLELLPQLQEAAPADLIATLSAIAREAADLRSLVARDAQRLIENHIRFVEHGFQVHGGDRRGSGSELCWRQALRECWIKMGWPLGQMTRQHWKKLFEAVKLSCETSLAAFQMPGNLRVSRKNGHLLIERVGDSFGRQSGRKNNPPTQRGG